MSEAFAETIRSQLAEAERELTADQVNRVWNGTSWANMISVLSGLGYLDCDYRLKVGPEDRRHAAAIVRKALGFAYLSTPWFARLLRPFRDPVDFWVQAGPKLRRLDSPLGRLIPPEEARVTRLKSLAAHVLRSYEANPSWTATEAEAAEAFRAFGLA